MQGILTTKPNPNPKVADEDPWSDGITEYENQHDETYIRLLDADKEGVDKDEMARLILGIDPTKEPERARKAVESHLARAIWMTQVGYRHLAAGRYPGAERKQAEQADLIRPLGMARPSRCAATPSASPATLHNASGSDCPTPCARSTLRRRSMTRVPEHRRFESRRTLACSAKAFPVPDNSLTYNAFYFSTVEDEQDIAISKQTGRVRLVAEENSRLATVVPIDAVTEITSVLARIFEENTSSGRPVGWSVIKTAIDAVAENFDHQDERSPSPSRPYSLHSLR